MRFVIIGGGIAGTTAAEELRKFNLTSHITLVSEEHHPLYSRVLLPHYVIGKIPRERVFLKKESWYEKQNIEWMRGISVTHLDPQNKFVGLTNGREVEYDKLLISTGGKLRTLMSDIRGVSYLRTLDDADYLLQLLNERNASDRAAVYGGGFIACDYLNIFAHYQMPTFIAFRGSSFWSRVLEPEAGEYINKHLLSHDVELYKNVQFSDARYHTCSILGVGIGTEPDDSWLRNAGIELNLGVRTDEYLQTSLPDVYAAGDIANFYDVNVDRHVTVGNWMNAQMQGRVVAKNMSGQKTKFSLVSSYATNVLGLDIIFVGDVSKQDADSVRMIGSADAGGIVQLFSRKNHLVGAVLLNRNTDRAVVIKMIKERRSVSEFPV